MLLSQFVRTVRPDPRPTGTGFKFPFCPFDSRTDVIMKITKFFRQKMSRPEGDLNPDLRIHADIVCLVFCGIEILFVKLTFEMPTVYLIVVIGIHIKCMLLGSDALDSTWKVIFTLFWIINEIYPVGYLWHWVRCRIKHVVKGLIQNEGSQSLVRHKHPPNIWRNNNVVIASKRRYLA